MSPGAAFALQIAAVVAVALLIVAIVAAASGACDAAAAGAAVHDVERALGAATLMTYDQAAAAAGKDWKKESLSLPPPSTATEEDAAAARQCCAICQSEYAQGDELVRVVPACGHFFHAGCDVDRWLRARRTCPLCRGGLWPLPRPPRPECPPVMQPRVAAARLGSP